MGRGSAQVITLCRGEQMHLLEIASANQCPRNFALAAILFLMPGSFQSLAQAQGKGYTVANPTSNRTIQVDGLSIFYREAGPKNAPTLLLLHGLPSSSRMFEPLLSRLSDHIHLVAPDYPGFGHSDTASPKEFIYTFDRIAEVMAHFTQAIGVAKYSMYMQDYGGPVGFRLAI